MRRQARQPAADRRGSRQRAAAATRFTLVWSGWDPGAPRANGGLGLDAPIATNNGAPIVRRIREEFISGTRGGELEQFRLSYEAASRDDARADGAAHARPRRGSRSAFEFVDARTVQLCRQERCRSPARSTNCIIQRRNPRVLGIGFAATRDHRQPSAQQRGGTRPARPASDPRSGFRHLAGRPLSARSPRTGLQSRRSGCARVRWRVHPCRRHRPGVLQHRVRPAGAHAHLARGSRFPRGGVLRFADRRADARRRQ